MNRQQELDGRTIKPNLNNYSILSLLLRNMPIYLPPYDRVIEGGDVFCHRFFKLTGSLCGVY